MSDPQFLDRDSNPLPRAILKTSFTAKGSEFLQLFREDRIAVYQLTNIEHGRIHFEVIIIQGHDGRVIKGAVVMPSEFYPSTSSWGLLGWTYNSNELADLKANELLVRFKIRKPAPARRRSPLLDVQPTPPISTEEAISRLLTKGELDRLLRIFPSAEPDSLGDRIMRCRIALSCVLLNTDEHRELADVLIAEAKEKLQTMQISNKVES